MHVLFCSDPLDPRAVDEPYAREFEAATRAGLLPTLVNYEALVHEGDVERSVKRVQAVSAAAVYRGWMLTVARYRQLYEALVGRGLRPLNNPAAYAYAHELPNWIADFVDVTPQSVVVPRSDSRDTAAIMAAIRPLGSAPAVLKDYVKSQKHYWNEACFIPNASDPAAVERVTRRFLELQGDSLVGGLVYRRYIELEPAGVHPKSGMPLAREYRIFGLDGGPSLVLPYWEVGSYSGDPPPARLIREWSKRVRNRFFTMDVAKSRSGDWLLIELGDGQVAGFPENARIEDLYGMLAPRLEGETRSPSNHACGVCGANIACGALISEACSDCGRAYCPTCTAGFCGDHGEPGQPCPLCAARLV